MQQIKLDDTIDFAVEGNEAWTIDYSEGLHRPKPGPRQCFNFGKYADVLSVTSKEKNIALITYRNFSGTIINLEARVSDDFIAFIDIDAPFGRHEDGTPAT